VRDIGKVDRVLPFGQLGDDAVGKQRQAETRSPCRHNALCHVTKSRLERGAALGERPVRREQRIEAGVRFA
jgi:hypothetical protein